MRFRTALSGALVGALCASSSAHAQGVRVGAYLGSSIATLSSAEQSISGPDVVSELRRRIGIQAGLWFNRPLQGRWSVQPEIHYTQKGVRYETVSAAEPGTSDVAVQFNLAYLEVPILLRVDLGNSGAVRPFLVAGPSVAYRTGCSFDIEADRVGLSVDCDQAEDDADGSLGLRTIDVSAVMGGGLAFQLGGRELTAGVRYGAGLVNIADDADNAKNRNFSVLLGIAF